MFNKKHLTGLLILVFISSAIYGYPPPKTKPPGKVARAKIAIKRVLGFKKSPAATKASYTPVRSRAETANSGQIRSNIQTSRGPATQVHVNINVTRVNMVQIVNTGQAPGRPVQASQVIGGNAAARAANQAMHMARLRVVQNAAARNPNAVPRPQGVVAGQAPRPLPNVPATSALARQPSTPVAVTSPGFGFVGGQKVARPQVQFGLPHQYGVLPNSPRTNPIHGQLPSVPANRIYESSSAPL